MAIKEIGREWSPCQCGYVKRFLLHSEDDVKDLPECGVGSFATVSETDNEYVYTADGWKNIIECDENGTGVTGGTGGGGAGLPETAEPLKQLVTDQDGKVTWANRLAYSTYEPTVFLEPTEMTPEGEEGGVPLHALTTPLASAPPTGVAHTVVYNGTEYDCSGVETDEGVSAIMLGNSDAMGIPGGNPDAPFLMIVIPPEHVEAMGFAVALYALDGATSVTIAMRGFTETSTKTIDKKYLPNMDTRLIVECETVFENNRPSIVYMSVQFPQILAACKAKREVVAYVSASGASQVMIFRCSQYDDDNVYFTWRSSDNNTANLYQLRIGADGTSQIDNMLVVGAGSN